MVHALRAARAEGGVVVAVAAGTVWAVASEVRDEHGIFSSDSAGHMKEASARGLASSF